MRTLFTVAAVVLTAAFVFHSALRLLPKTIKRYVSRESYLLGGDHFA